MIDSSPPERGRHLLRVRIDYVAGFIPSGEGQTSSHTLTSHRPTIHPFLRRADFCHKSIDASHIDSSLPTKGSRKPDSPAIDFFRFIPSCERQTYRHSATLIAMMVHPFLRRADFQLLAMQCLFCDSSLPEKGRLTHTLHLCGGGRFIPSCEGQTR